MTNQQHPIVPPPDKIHNWLQLEKIGYTIEQIITAAAQYGADQELEACCNWLHEELKLTLLTLDVGLRAARRPKPPSLKELALETLQRISKDKYPCNYQEDSDWDTIRRALEALPE
jgi:hypothetical protein